MSEQFSLELPETTTVTYYTNIKYASITYDEHGINLLYRTDSESTIPNIHDAREYDEPIICKTYGNIHDNGSWSYWRVTDNGKYINFPLWIEDKDIEKYRELQEVEQQWISILKKERETPKDEQTKEWFEFVSGHKRSVLEELRYRRHAMGFAI